MADRILVPFDGSPLSRRALEHSLAKFPGASITTVYVIDPVDSIRAVEAGGLSVADEWFDDAQERATSIQKDATELAATHDGELDTVTRVGQPAGEILEYAEEHDVDQIVMGSHDRKGLERVILGSVAETVLRRAPMPVTIVR